jgi:hypothetical protein
LPGKGIWGARAAPPAGARSPARGARRAEPGARGRGRGRGEYSRSLNASVLPARSAVVVIRALPISHRKIGGCEIGSARSRASAAPQVSPSRCPQPPFPSRSLKRTRQTTSGPRRIAANCTRLAGSENGNVYRVRRAKPPANAPLDLASLGRGTFASGSDVNAPLEFPRRSSGAFAPQSDANAPCRPAVVTSGAFAGAKRLSWWLVPLLGDHPEAPARPGVAAHGAPPLPWLSNSPNCGGGS